MTARSRFTLDDRRRPRFCRLLFPNRPPFCSPSFSFSFFLLPSFPSSLAEAARLLSSSATIGKRKSYVDARYARSTRLKFHDVTRNDST